MKQQRQPSALVISVLANERGMTEKKRRKHERVRRELAGSDLRSPHPGAIRGTPPVPHGDTGGMKM